MKKFDATKDYWELRGNKYEYNGPEWVEEGYWIREEFKEALINEAKKWRAKEVWKDALVVFGVIGFLSLAFYIFTKAIK